MIVIILFIFIISDFIYTAEINLGHKNESYYHYIQGLIYKQAGDYIQAQREFEKTIELDPNAISVYRELIISYINSGDIKKVSPVLETLRNLISDDDTNSILFIGGIYNLLNDTKNAIDYYNKVLNKEPTNINAIASLGTLYLNLDTEKSIYYWKKYIELSPESEEGYYQIGFAYAKLGKIEEAKKILNESINKFPDNLAPLLALGQIYENEKDYLNAALIYEKAINIEPKNILFLIKTGSLYFMAKKYSESEKFLTVALKQYPENINVNFWLSLLYEEKKDWLRASKHLKITLNKEPSLAGYIRLSYYYTQLEDNDSAISILQKATKLYPDSPEPYFFLGLGYYDLKKYRKAEKYFDKAVKIQPNFADAYFYLGIIYEQLSKFEKSVQYLRKVIELDPGNANALNYLGYSFADRNINLDEAETMIKKALEIDPENSAYIDSLGWVYFRKGMFIESEQELRKAANKTKDPVIFDHLGDVLFKLGKNLEALEYYNKSLELDKTNKKVKEKIEKLNKEKWYQELK